MQTGEITLKLKRLVTFNRLTDQSIDRASFNQSKCPFENRPKKLFEKLIEKSVKVTIVKMTGANP